MEKRLRQYLGIIFAAFSYFLIHEGAHLIAALMFGVFREIDFMGIGIQIDIFPEKLSDAEMAIFCFAGFAATIFAAYLLVISRDYICRKSGKILRACFYYTTLALLFIDPLYLSFLCGFFGGGDMNGIALVVPEIYARIGSGMIFLLNTFIFTKYVLPYYKKYSDKNP